MKEFNTIHPATSVCALGVLLHSELSMSNHVTNIASTCSSNFDVCDRSTFSRSRSHGAAIGLSAFVISRLDYYISDLAHLSRGTSAYTLPTRLLHSH